MCKYLFSFIFLFSTASSYGQININSNGDVSVDGTFEVGNPYSSYHQMAIKCGASCGGSFAKYGLYVSSESSPIQQYGIYSRSLGSGSNYGIKGYAEFGTVNRGVIGEAIGSNSYGGYFTGGLYVSGGITQSSDERLKTNLRALSNENISSKILQLEPLRYEFLSTEELKQRGLPASHTDKGEHFGLSAQELEQVFPELVSDVVHVLETENGDIGETPKTVTTKAINYQELTVVLLSAVQELQQRVEALEAQLNE